MSFRWIQHSVCTPACRADLNGDGTLDPDDFADAIGCFFDPGCLFDYNSGGFEDPDDLVDFVSDYFNAANGCAR